MLVARRVRALRRGRGPTVEALAAAAGVHEGHLSRIERGETAPSVAPLGAIAAALDAQVSDLWGKTAHVEDVPVVRRCERGVAHAVQAVPPGSALHGAEPGDALLAHDRAARDGQEIADALEGRVEPAVADRGLEPGPGGRAIYDGSPPHRPRRRDGHRAAALVVIANGSPGRA